jgi:hypothetical protein
MVRRNTWVIRTMKDGQGYMYCEVPKIEKAES